jgi:hypothetical protein
MGMFPLSHVKMKAWGQEMVAEHKLSFSMMKSNYTVLFVQIQIDE